MRKHEKLRGVELGIGIDESPTPIRKSRIHWGLLAVLGIASISTSAAAATSGDNGSHDPSRMLESEGRVYIYSTGGGSKSSADGLVWRTEVAPTWNRSLANNQGIWAPDGIFLNGQYYLYGSMWSAAKASALVLLTSPTLNPTSPNYKWTDHGVVVDGPVGVTHSVIDPAPLLDNDGNLWIVWGGGYPFATTVDSIFLTPLDKTTGLPLTSDPGYRPPNSPGYALEQGHKEGPYIHYHGGFYFLFYQTGNCCNPNSSYVMHVARSASVKGPYTGDRVFYATTTGIVGPGHMGVYAACGFERFTYHYYPNTTGGSLIGENELMWSADGWPVVGPESTTPLKPCGSNGNGGTNGSGGVAGGSGGNGGVEATGGAPGSGAVAATGGMTGGTSGISSTGGAGTGGAPVVGSGGFPAGSGGSSGTGGRSESGGSVGSVAGGTGGLSDAGCSCDVSGRQDLDGATGIGLIIGTMLMTVGRKRRRSRSRAAHQPRGDRR